MKWSHKMPVLLYLTPRFRSRCPYKLKRWTARGQHKANDGSLFRLKDMLMQIEVDALPFKRDALHL